MSDVVRDFMKDHPDINYVNKEVFYHCYYKIKPWLDFHVLCPYLMKYQIVNDSNDIECITGRWIQPQERMNSLIRMIERGGTNGFMVLYICIYETSKETNGHADAIKELDKIATQKLISPPWEREVPKRMPRGDEPHGEFVTRDDEEPKPKSSTSSDPTSSITSGFASLIESEPEIDEAVGNAIAELEDALERLAELLLSELRENGTRASEICDYIALLPLSLNKEIYVSVQRHIADIEEKKTLLTLFQFLNGNMWNIIDYNLLEYIINKFGSGSLKDSMKVYVSKLEGFRQNTSVYQFTKWWPGRSQKFPDYIEVRMKVEQDSESYTLEDLNKIRQGMCKNFLPPLSEYAVFHYKHRLGCFMITWIMPLDFAIMLRQKVISQPKSCIFFEDHAIQSLFIHNEKIYSASKKEPVPTPAQGHVNPGHLRPLSVRSRIHADTPSSESPSGSVMSLDRGIGSSVATSQSPCCFTSVLPSEDISHDSNASSSSDLTPEELLPTQSRVPVDFSEVSRRLSCFVLEKSDAMPSVTFGKRLKRDKLNDKGILPSVSLNIQNTVVEVNHQAGSNWMYYRVGELLEESIQWRSPPKKIYFGCGTYPKVALNDKNSVIEVHKGQYLDKCFYRLGKVDLAVKRIVWGNSKCYNYGYYPTIAINNDNVVVTVFQDNLFLKNLNYRVGQISSVSNEVSWITRKQRIQGIKAESFSIDMNENGLVILSYQTDMSNHVKCKVGRLNMPRGSIDWRESDHICHGFSPCVTINNDNYIILIHQSLQNRHLVSNVGFASWDEFKGIKWSGEKDVANRHYGKGIYPCVSLNDHGRVVEIHEPRLAPMRNRLHYYIGQLLV